MGALYSTVDMAYPRPQMVRKTWKNLNGQWKFAFDDTFDGIRTGCPEESGMDRAIEVPFTYETEMSGIHEEAFHPCVVYSRQVALSKSDLAGRLLLHFEGSDFETEVWVNGLFVGRHTGAYERFTFDITDAAREGKNQIAVRVTDSDRVSQPRGKQRWVPENFACWYVQTTGIWKTVWMETVPASYIEGLKLTPDLGRGVIRIEADLAIPSESSAEWALRAEVSYDGTTVSTAEASVRGGRAVLEAGTVRDGDVRFAFGPVCWSPENPALYDLRLVLVRKEGQDTAEIDEVQSYFGMREIGIQNGKVLLNGRPIYQKLILDQGYWPQSGLTPPSAEALVEDIDKIHAAGFNGLRKHMKVEDERFLYWCDRKGMLVWSEMAAAYEFTDRAVRQFTEEWMQVVKQNYSHPCIITWTPFNESWGVPEIRTSGEQQAFTEAVYYLTKAVDPMRPVICNDGWEHTVSDILTLHDYEEFGERFMERYADLDEIVSGAVFPCLDRPAFADGFTYRGQPVIISEYGGIAFSQKQEGQWGYGGSVKDQAEYLARFRKITEAIQNVPYIVGYCYTQVADVQQEVNGIMTGDRRFKLPPEQFAEVNARQTAMHR